MSSASTGVTVTPAVPAGTVCSSRPPGPRAGTIRMSASETPATLVTVPVRASPSRRTVGVKRPGADASPTVSAPVVVPSASAPSSSRVPRLQQQRTVASTALERYGTGATARPNSSSDDRGLACAGSRATQVLGNQQARQSEFAGEGFP